MSLSLRSQLPLATRKLAPIALLGLVLLSTSCADAPVVPDDAPGLTPVYLAVSPRLATVADDNTVAAQQAAFDRVDNYRAVVRRIQSGEVVKDTVIQVQAGAEAHDLTIPLQINSGEESFILELTALEGQTPLFSVEATVTASVQGDSGGGTASTPVTLEYTGPGANATAVRFVPEALVVSPGGTGVLRTRVLDAEGRELTGVPLAFSTSATDVATVSGSTISGGSEGQAQITVSTPGGLTATGTVYVVAGEVAYTSSGSIYQARVGGTSASERTPGVTGASQPAWHPGGGSLYYVAGGTVRAAGGAGPNLTGEWPSVSPDGSKLAVQRGSSVWFANVDGSNPTQGPQGRQPQWSGPSELIVAGGSIERVGAEDGTRQTITGDGGAELPAVGPGGQVAWVSGGGLFAGGENLLQSGVSALGRPSWSPNGNWLVVSASSANLGPTLHVVPADGSGPAVALGIETTSDERNPAWRPTGPAATPAAVNIQALSPSRPLPGDEVEVQGSGFDGIIPGNNRVFFPTESGPVEAAILSSSSSSITAVAPEGLTTGTLRVTTFTGEGTFGFDPSVGSLRVVARTSYGKNVSGVGLRVTQSDETVATGTTGEDGTATFSNLFSGNYGLEVTGVREGFQVSAPSGPHTVSLDATTTVDLAVEVEIVALELTSETPVQMEAPGEEAEAAVEAQDVDGDAVPTAEIGWVSDKPGVAAVEGSGPSVVIRGVSPGDAVVTASVSDLSTTIEVSVQGAASGSVITSGGKGVSGSTVELRSGSEVLASASTDANGEFRMTGLPTGVFDLVLADLRDGFEDPEGGASRSVDLTEGSEEPTVTFTVRALVSSLTLSQTELILTAPGEEATLDADAKDVDGDAVPDPSIEWTVSDPAILELGASGDAGALTAGTSVRVTGLAPGEGTVTASVGEAEASASVSVLGGIRGTVGYDYGAPFPGAEIVVTQAGTEVGRTTSDADGSFLVDELGVGDYSVQLILEDGFSAEGGDVQDVTVATGEPAPEVQFLVNPEARALELQVERELLQQGDTIEAEALVQDARGEPIPDAEVDWASSDTSVIRVEPDGDGAAAGVAAIIGGRTARIIAEGPGQARVTAAAGTAEDGVDMEVQGAIRGVLVRTDGRGFEGGTVRLRQGGTEVADPVVTGGDGAFEFLDLAPGDYSVQVELPDGFSVVGDNPRTVTVGPGLGLVEIQVKPEIREVTISPSEPTVEAGSSVSVTATALDARGEPVTQVSQIEWRGVSGHVSARGTSFTGTLKGVYPTIVPGEALFSIVIEGRAFEFRATVTSFIAGKVVDGSGNGISGVEIHLLQGEEQVGSTLTAFGGTYRFGGLFQGGYTVVPIPPGDESVSPQSASFSLGVEQPSGQADFVIGAAGPVDLTGRPILVFGDRGERTTVGAELEGLGMSVTIASTLPSDLSPYDAIIHIGAFVALTAAERSALETFVNTGKGLHLTGERPCCETMNNGHEPLINALVTGGGVQLGGLGDFSGTFPFNPSARGSFSSNPNTLTEWFPSAPGGITGVSGANVLVTHSATGTPVGAIWSEADMISGQGRLTVLMDVNWPSNSSNHPHLLENMATFLVAGAPNRAGQRREEAGALRYLDAESRLEAEKWGPATAEDRTVIPQGHPGGPRGPGEGGP